MIDKVLFTTCNIQVYCYCSLEDNLTLSYLMSDNLTLSYLINDNLTLSYLMSDNIMLSYLISDNFMLSYLISDNLTLIAMIRLMENVRVRRAGYAFRQDYIVFLNRYKVSAIISSAIIVHYMYIYI